MKKFLVTQKFEASSDDVVAAFRSEDVWQAFHDLPFVGTPQVQSFESDDAGAVRIETAYRVDIDLPPLADKFIDADKMTFVEVTTLQPDGSGSFEILPDHYKKLLKASGTITMVPLDDGHCERMIQGSVDLSLGWTGKLFEDPVEGVIVDGFKQALAAQALQVVDAPTA